MVNDKEVTSGWIVKVTFRNHPPGTLFLSLWEDLDSQLDQEEP